MKRTAAVIAGLGVVLAIAGCSAESEPSTVTEDQYRTAFNTFVECMEREGYPVSILDESGTTVDYAIPGSVVGTDAEEECYGPFRDMDMAWQIANEDTSDDALAVRECLVEHDIEPAGTAAGDWELVLAHGLEKTC